MTPANADRHWLTTTAHIRDALGPRAINGALFITGRPQSKQRHPLNIESVNQASRVKAQYDGQAVTQRYPRRPVDPCDLLA
ncbi:hypothetical protein ROHU_008357 [Labeo rohita]|uniref:Uncharacterized protein n=1 Tax=Labeo rohita TaxID=84645 RepID=A0A498MB25_LABRO|nr:hypothetical protein ROHU_008357 [Labeo rohita]